jgi:hypothetical protein
MMILGVLVSFNAVDFFTAFLLVGVVVGWSMMDPPL